MDDVGNFLIWLIGCLVCMYFYFAPTVVAHYRRHDNAVAVFVLNLFLGWTFVGWVAALVWAFLAKPAPVNAS
jgi:hypothetical protein